MVKECLKIWFNEVQQHPENLGPTTGATIFTLGIESRDSKPSSHPFNPNRAYQPDR
jgi:hypothetical protein